MRPALKVLVGLAILLAVMGVVGLSYLKITGLRAQASPGRLETFMARTVRGFAIPSATRARSNPLPPSPENLAAGMEHFSSYCTECHGTDGSGDGSAFGKGLFPKPPDLRSAQTQGLTDGEIFHIIINGVRFTGMPAFGTGNEKPEDEELAWQLVHFVRHIPEMTVDEIQEVESKNPL
jgi:mono/diheme cytochrome c family protein